MNRRALCLLALVWPACCALADEAPVSNIVIGGANEHLIAAADALRAGDAEEAIRLSLLGLAEIVPERDRAGGLGNLCGAYMLADEPELAIARCSEAIELWPRWQSYHNRALAYMRTHRLDLAARDIEAGFALHPDSLLLRRARASLDELLQRDRPDARKSPAEVG